MGNGDARRLLASFGSPAANFAQAPTALTNVVTPKQAQALFQEPHEVTLQCVRTQQWLAHAAPGVGHTVWTLGDHHYPEALLQLADPPLMLYAQGQIEAWLGNAVAVVGSRNPTSQGAQTAEQFGRP